MYHPADMRKAGPILIVLIGVLALIINFFPNLTVPDSTSPTREPSDRDEVGPRPVRRPARRVPGAEGRRQVADRRGHGDHQGHHRAPGEHDRRLRARRRHPGRRPRSWSSCRASPTPTRSASSSARPAASTSSRSAPRAATEGQVLDLAKTPPLFSGDQVSSASIGNDQSGGLTVNFVLKDDGANRFADFTCKHVGDYFAITLDSTVISAPRINEAIPGGNVQITRRRHRRVPGDGSQQPRDDPEVRLAAVPDPRAVERAHQRDPRVPVPEPEPARRRARHPDGDALHGHLLPGDRPDRLLRARLLHAGRASRSSGSSR